MRRSSGWRRRRPIARRPRRNPALVHLQAALRLYAEEKYEQALGAVLRGGDAQISAARACRLLRRRVRAAPATIRGCEDAICRPERDPRVLSAKPRRSARRRPRRRWATTAMRRKSTKTSSRRSRSRCAGDLAEPRRLRRSPTAIASGRPKRTCICITSFHSASTLPRPRVRCRRCRRCSRSRRATRATSSRLGRGERLFGGRRYPEARASFLRLKPHATERRRRARVAAARRDRIFPGALQQRARGAAAISDERRAGRPRRASSI